MRRRTLRFKPPRLVVDRDRRWLLARAFGKPDMACERPTPEGAMALAARSALAPRIAARTSLELLEAEIGEGARTLSQSRTRALAHALAYDGVADRIAEVAGGLDVAVFLLKGAALLTGGYAPPGSRDVGDLDILVAAESSSPLYSALAGAGFEPSSGERNEHHLPPLAAPSWGTVDLHDVLRGVCAEDGRWLTAADLRTAGSPRTGANGCWVPDRCVLAAHALAHALDQHGESPRALPLLRLLADLNDLLPAAADWEMARPGLLRRLRGTLAEAEIDAAGELAITLRQGKVPAADSDAGRLLSHLMEHALDERYRARLRGRHLRRRVIDSWRRGSLLRYAFRKLEDRRR